MLTVAQLNLREAVCKCGIVKPGNMLDVSDILNQRVDYKLMEEIGKDIAAHFKEDGVTDVITIEASGIVPAMFTARALGARFQFLKKVHGDGIKGIDPNEAYSATVQSFTKGTNCVITTKRRHLPQGARVLGVDDFLANGNAALGMAEVTNMAGAEFIGLGIVLEKGFQNGRMVLAEKGINNVYSVGIIESMSPDKGIKFMELKR